MTPMNRGGFDSSYAAHIFCNCICISVIIQIRRNVASGKLLHVFKSSDIAEGMQCVARISGVASFDFFVAKTTIC